MKLFLTPLFIGVTTFCAMAQVQVTGTVIDKTTGESLSFVNVTVKNSTIGTTTNENGTYSIQANSMSDSIQFSFIGYQSETFAIPKSRIINPRLTAGASQLDEMVVTALGIEREKKDLGYAIQKMEAQAVSEVKAVNFLDNLSGKLAGVTISQGATGVGSSSKIVIRGEQSFTNNNPLFVIDGIIINNSSIINNTNESASGFQPVDFGNGAMDINPDDIESVSVLKGPAAAALYGTRASNGVIIINTKSGNNMQAGKLGVSFNTSTFVDAPFQLPNFQNTYGQGNSGQFEYVDGLGGGVNDNITYSYGPRLDAGIFTTQYDGPVTMPDGRIVRGGDIYVHGGLPITPTELKSHPNNLKNFYETGVTTTNNIAISKMTNAGSFRFSFTDMNSDSYIPGVNLMRKVGSARMNFKLNEKIRVNTSINYINTQSDNRPASQYGSENINYSLVAWGPRSLDIEPMKNYWQPGLEGTQQYSYNYTYFDNPYFTLYENRNSFNRDRLFSNVVLNYAINDHWNLSAGSGLDYSNELRRLRRAFSSNRFKTGAYAENAVYFREVNSNFLLTRKDKFGAISSSISVGANRMDQQASFNQTQANSLAQPGIYALSNAASPLEVINNSAEKRINSVYGIAKFGYRNFLFVDVTGRNDWSSALATPVSTEGSSFFYPSISSSLVLSEIMDLPKSISFAQLRASYAQVGNDTDPYQTASTFVAATPYLSQPTLTEQSIIPNSNLLPERTTALEFGADIRLFDDRLNLDVTYYDALTENQIIALPVATSSGYTQQVVNGAEVNSKGLEAIITARAIRTDDFDWTTQLNFSRNVSTVGALPEGVDKLTLGYNRVYDNANQTVYLQVEEGGRIGDLYGTGYLKNEAGQFVVDQDGKFIVDNTLQKLGNYNPDFIIGWNNQFRYKNFNLGFLIDWRQGGIIVSRTQALAGVAGQLDDTENRPEEGIIIDGVVNTGTDENPNYVQNTTAISAEQYYRSYYDRNHEENNTFDATYIKLRQFSLGYTFDTKQSSGWMRNVNGLNISIVGRNLFAFAPEIRHFDPEQLAVQGNSFVSGVEDMAYPSARSIGLKLSFNL